MENQRATDLTSLPTRRSLRAAQSLSDSSPVPAPPTAQQTGVPQDVSARAGVMVAERAQVPAQPLTRRALHASGSRRDMHLHASDVDLVAPQIPAPAFDAPSRRSVRQGSEPQVRSMRLSSDTPAPRSDAQPRDGQLLTRSQLRELERAAAQHVAARREEPVQLEPDVTAELSSPVPAPHDEPAQARPSALSATVVVPPLEDEPEQALAVEAVVAEVEAVMAQVQRRVEEASHGATTGPEPVILHPGYEEAVDTHSPVCDVHRTGEIAPVDFITGTSITLGRPDTAEMPVAPSPMEAPEELTAQFDEVVAGEFEDSSHSTAIFTAFSASEAFDGPTDEELRKVAHKRNWLPRMAVLSTLGLATVGVPMLANGAADSNNVFTGSGNDVEISAIGPNTITVIAEASSKSAIPEAIAQSVSEDERAVLVASRSEERTALANCDPQNRPAGTNGQLDMTKMCKVNDGFYLQPEAAVSFAELNKAFNARFGHDLCLVSGYRDLANQYSVKRTRGSLAATPGKSNHGWGNAVDLCASSYQAPVKWQWLHANAPKFGWALPDWASRTYEPWHWEFTKGVSESQ